MKTEIFGTFGPACASEKTLGQMIKMGMTGMRLNLSHTTLSDSESYIRNYQKAAKQMGTMPQVLIDMQGPELRVGRLKQPLQLDEGIYVQLCVDEAEEHSIPLPQAVMEEVEIGDELLLDDGKILVQVVKDTMAQVVRGGILQSHKSVKIIGKNVKLPPLTAHDVENIKLAKTYGVTALMQPFVLDEEDIQYVRSVLDAHGAADIQIFAKIENRQGVEKIEDILQEADVIVIARGDLGNDVPLWELPKVQKQMEAACQKAGKPYIVVTQMLSSMEVNPVPTRAEVSDIFHAVYHGAWGVMLTGETAIGRYPVEAIQYLANTAREAEKYNE